MKKTRIFISKIAEQDTEEITLYLALDNPPAETKFREALEATYTLLSTMPDMGSTRDYHNPRFSNLRMFPIKKFENYLIFYQSTEEELLVVRVLHGARDIAALFEEEENN
jgi:toxin ParE1/3/4